MCSCTPCTPSSAAPEDHFHLETFERDFGGGDTIRDIKLAIQEQSKIDPNVVRLFYPKEEEILFSDNVLLSDVFGENENVEVDFTTDPAALRKVTKRNGVNCTILEVDHTNARVRDDIRQENESEIDLKRVRMVSWFKKFLQLNYTL